MRDHRKIKTTFILAAGAIIVLALAVFLFLEKTLFYQESLLKSVMETVEVPFENSRPYVYLFLILLVVLMGADVVRGILVRRRRPEPDRNEEGERGGLLTAEKLPAFLKNETFKGIIKTVILSVAAAVNAVWSFYLIELINNYYMLNMKTPYIHLGVGITAVLELVILLACNSFTVGMIFSNWFFFLWAVVNYFVQQFRGIPFQWVDFSSAKTAFSVAGNYEFTPNWQIVAGLVITCAVSFLWYHAKAYHSFRSVIGKIASRVFAAAFLFLFGTLIFRTNYLSDQGIWLRDWQPWYTYRLFGMEAGFFAFAKASFPEAPESYSEERVQEIIREFREENAPAADTGDDTVVPENIICIMNESFTDLTIYPNFKADQDLTQNVMSLRENTQSGKLLVSVKGGTTANTEYEFLTGNSCVLSPTTVVYNSFIKQDQYSLVKTMKENGYRSVALHPYGQYGWNRNTVYPKMGFDEFLHRDNYFTGAEKVRGLVSDAGNYQALIDLVEGKEEGEKLFLFNITMQNHSSYKSPNLTSTVTVEGFDGKNLGQAEQFCTLLKMSDEAIADLLEYFEKSDEKTLILFWGDHQPEIGDDFWEYCYGKKMNDLDFAEQQMQYETRWFLWANYDIPEAEDLTMSVNYLGSYLLEQAGLAETDYERYLTAMQDVIPAMNAYGYMGQDGTMHQWNSEDAGPEELKKLDDYLCLIYDELTGGGNRDESFFALSSS